MSVCPKQQHSLQLISHSHKSQQIVFFHWVGKNNHIPHTWESSKLRWSKLHTLSDKDVNY